VSGFGTRLKVKERISVEAMRIITLVFIAFLVLATPAVSFSGTYALSRGIAEYSFNPVYTTQVFGWMNLSVVKVYGDYFRNGTFLDRIPSAFSSTFTRPTGSGFRTSS